MVRLQPDALAQLDGWIAAQPDTPSRPEAARRLIARALDIEAGISATETRIEDHARRSVGPEDEARGGHEAPDAVPGPTAPGLAGKRRKA